MPNLKIYNAIAVKDGVGLITSNAQILKYLGGVTVLQVGNETQITVTPGGLAGTAFNVVSFDGAGNPDVSTGLIYDPAWGTAFQNVIPKVTTAERNAILAPSDYFVVYNLSLNKFQYALTGSWTDVNAGTASVVGSPDSIAYFNNTGLIDSLPNFNFFATTRNFVLNLGLLVDTFVASTNNVLFASQSNVLNTSQQNIIQGQLNNLTRCQLNIINGTFNTLTSTFSFINGTNHNIVSNNSIINGDANTLLAGSNQSLVSGDNNTCQAQSSLVLGSYNISSPITGSAVFGRYCGNSDVNRYFQVGYGVGPLHRDDLFYVSTDFITHIRKLNIRESNNRMGAAALIGGTKTINTTEVTNTSRVFLTAQDAGGGVGNWGEVGVSSRVAGVSFTISSTNAADDRTFAWLIINPE